MGERGSAEPAEQVGWEQGGVFRENLQGCVSAAAAARRHGGPGRVIGAFERGREVADPFADTADHPIAFADRVVEGAGEDGGVLEMPSSGPMCRRPTVSGIEPTPRGEARSFGQL